MTLGHGGGRGRGRRAGHGRRGAAAVVGGRAGRGRGRRRGSAPGRRAAGRPTSSTSASTSAAAISASSVPTSEDREPPARRRGDPRADRGAAAQAPLLVGRQRRAAARARALGRGRRRRRPRSCRALGVGGRRRARRRGRRPRTSARPFAALLGGGRLGRGGLVAAAARGAVASVARAAARAGARALRRVGLRRARSSRSPAAVVAPRPVASLRGALAGGGRGSAARPPLRRGAPRGRRGQIEPAARAEVRVARVQLAAARARAADAGLAQHGLAARRRRARPRARRSSASSAARRWTFSSTSLPAVLLAAVRLVDEAAEVAQRELAGAAQEARAAAQLAAAPGRRCGARGPRAATPAGRRLPVRAGGGRGSGADPWAGSGSAVGSVRVSSAAPGRLMRRRRPLMLSGTRRSAPSERV